MATVTQTEALSARRLAAAEIAAAIDLGWRVAALHALSPATLRPPPAAGDLLLNHRSLGATDRLELELRAIASVAERAGTPLAPDALTALLDLVPAAATSPSGEDRFRLKLAETHIDFAKRLWAREEADGRAYELGNFLSDTWNRLQRRRTHAEADDELRMLFSSDRVQRIKMLLDNLQTRLDPAAVHVVDKHLDSWRDRVAELPPRAVAGTAAASDTDDVAREYEPVERQTVIWRQILTGAKEPEAYIGHARRAEIRDELSGQLWRRYRRWWWVVPIVAVLGAVVGYLLANESGTAGSVIGTLTAVAGVVGVTRASVIGTVRRGLQDWGELMWNRALATVICRETLVVDELLPARRGMGAHIPRPRGVG